MKSATKEKLASFFSMNYQYVIPFFQRAYVWKEENWAEFLSDIEDEVDAHNRGEDSEHFIGTVITKPIVHSSLSSSRLELIDGQQRLTTIALVLKAIGLASGDPSGPLARRISNDISFEDSYGASFIRIEHSDIDRPAFEQIMNASSLEDISKDLKGQIVSGLYFFYHALRGSDHGRLALMRGVVLEKLPVIAMNLDAKDDEQAIFDTINSLGVKLTVGELLKNYLFRGQESRQLYDLYWKDVFESDDDTVGFWNSPRTQGRVKRTNLEVLLYCFLIVETVKEVRLDRLYKSYQSYVDQLVTPQQRKGFLDRLRTYAELYRRFPDENRLAQFKHGDAEERAFYTFDNLSISTVYPLLLFLYSELKDSREEAIRCASLIESYVVRRMLCRLTSKNYNKFFISVVRGLKQRGATYQNLGIELKGSEEDTVKFPSDKDIEVGILSNKQPNTKAKPILFCIALYERADRKHDISELSPNSFSVEHIMPIKWEQHWRKSSLSDDAVQKRRNRVKTIGNLTLVTQSLNSTLKHHAWMKKRRNLKKFSTLPMTIDYVELDDWNEVTIENRGKNLAKEIVKAWPR